MAHCYCEVLVLLTTLLFLLFKHAVQFLAHIFCPVSDVDDDCWLAYVRLLFYTERHVPVLKLVDQITT